MTLASPPISARTRRRAGADSRRGVRRLELRASRPARAASRCERPRPYPRRYAQAGRRSPGYDAPQQPADHAAEDAFRARSAVVRRARRCTISPIAAARSTPRTSISGASPTEVGTPFYCYSSAAIERHFRVFSAAFAERRPGLLCDEGQFQPGGADDPGAPRRWDGRGLRGRIAARARRRRARRKDHIFRRRQDPRRNGLGLDEDILCFNVESEPELEALSEVAVARGADRARSPSASIRTSTRAPTPKSRPASRRTSSACRFRAPATSTPAPAPCPASRSTASTCISARRSPTCSRSTTPSRCSPISCARCAPTATDRPCRSRRRPRHSLSLRQRSAAASRALRRDRRARARARSAARCSSSRAGSSSATPACW